MSGNQTLLWVNEPATSGDPLRYDSYVHHVCFTSVIAGLVTKYEAGGYAGEIAEAWETSDDYRVWKFRLRKGLKFENGDVISPAIALTSLKRAAILMKRSGSISELFRRVVGIESLVTIKDQVPGLEADGDSLTIRLTESLPRTLELRCTVMTKWTGSALMVLYQVRLERPP
jgi:ABC-type transport system substrate-binding protein